MSDYDDNRFPLGYLITVRCYGTGLHGNDRLSVDRHGLNIYGKRRRPANPKLEKLMLQNMQSQSVILSESQRKVVNSAIIEVCEHRGYKLWAVNVLTTISMLSFRRNQSLNQLPMPSRATRRANFAVSD